MLKTLPYNALRTLEAVVRLRGFGRAAEEMNLTQSAVSQHIKLLENWLGHRLLIRQNPHTVPTEHGARLATAVRDGFSSIELICDEMRESPKLRSSGVLVAAPPGFAFIWLLPRLIHFDEQNPDVPFSLSTDPKSQDPATSEADAIIAYSAGGFPQMHAEPIMSEFMAPVCAPELAEKLNTIEDLASFVILQDETKESDWRSNWDFWAKEVNVTLPHFPKTRKYGQANLVIQAAINGSGIAMGRSPLVVDAINEGKLVYAFPQIARSQFSYWFVCRHDAMKLRPVQAFRNWIHAEADKPES
ncbi:LysR substrate-binding domain-containing protein [Lentibacter algarum]|uniref:LysR substrate-binding domain-containing protein n=1 Tax=Lentibacter algarum TaxID=576131 RepID=UPI003BB079A9